MKKKTLSLALTLVLALSLAVPAFAADRPLLQGGDQENTDISDSFTVTRQGTNENLYAEKTVEVGYQGMEEAGQEYDTIPGYYLTAPDTTWTITNTSKDSKAYLTVIFTPYENDGDGSRYSYRIMDDAYLKRDGSFDYGVEGYDDPAEEELTHLYPGQSVTFKLSDALTCLERDPSEDVLYCLCLRLFQDNSGSEQWEVAEINYKIDSQAALDPTPAVPSVSFTDVESSDWFYESVQWAVEQEITNGTSADKFSPKNTCTNAQIITFLWRAQGSPEPSGTVTGTEYYAKAVQWAAEHSIISDAFDPAAPCTRGMTVDYLWKNAGSPEAEAKTAFTDVTDGTDLAKAVAWAVEQEITTGTSADKFSPDTTCTRGHIVTFLFRDMGQ